MRAAKGFVNRFPFLSAFRQQHHHHRRQQQQQHQSAHTIFDVSNMSDLIE